MEIGLRIKTLRTDLKITQEELAKVLQVSTQAVSKWECGGLPDIELIPKIAEYFNITTDELFGLEVNNYKNFEQKLSNYISSIANERNSYKEIFKLCYLMSISINDNQDISKYDIDKIMEGSYLNSQNLCDNGLALTQFKNGKQFFALFPKINNETFNGFLKNKDSIFEFIKYLSDKDFFNTLIFVNTRVNNSFTSKILIKELNLSEEKATDIINSLNKYHLLIDTKLELDDEIISTYQLSDNPGIVGLFAFLDMFVEKPNAFYYSRQNVDGQYFK